MSPFLLLFGIDEFKNGDKHTPVKLYAIAFINLANISVPKFKQPITKITLMILNKLP